MNFTVINHDIKVGCIQSPGISSSALLLVGDAEFIILSSILDTPPESLIEGPFVPLILDLPSA
jgi:spore germination protein PD